MNPIFERIFSDKLSGYVIIGFNPIREVSILELRSNHSWNLDSSYSFYRMRLLGYMEDNDFNLKRYYRVKAISQKYITYSLSYSFERIEEISEKLSKSEYSSFIIIKTDDVIYKLRLLDLRLIRRKQELDICSKKSLYKEIQFDEYIEVNRSLV